jgi:hypothetical protein
MTPETKTATWQVIAVTDGYALSPDEITALADDTVEDVRIMIVRGSAAPISYLNSNGVKYLRMPGSWCTEDVAGEWDWFDDRAQFDRRWAQAQAMVAGLNAVTPK